jgi:hypothetical protein
VADDGAPRWDTGTADGAPLEAIAHIQGAGSAQNAFRQYLSPHLPPTKEQLVPYCRAPKIRNCAIKPHDIPPKSVKGWTEHLSFAAGMEPGA